MQFAYIEAGEIAENIQLTAAGLNLAATDIGGYEKGADRRFPGAGRPDQTHCSPDADRYEEIKERTER